MLKNALSKLKNHSLFFATMVGALLIATISAGVVIGQPSSSRYSQVNKAGAPALAVQEVRINRLIAPQLTTSPVGGNPNSPPVAQPNAIMPIVKWTYEWPAPGVLGNDTDADGDHLTARLTVPPRSGKLELNSDGGFTYTPVTEYKSYDDFFMYVASDGKAESEPTRVDISVQERPFFESTKFSCYDESGKYDPNITFTLNQGSGWVKFVFPEHTLAITKGASKVNEHVPSVPIWFPTPRPPKFESRVVKTLYVQPGKKIKVELSAVRQDKRTVWEAMTFDPSHIKCIPPQGNPTPSRR